MMEAFDKYFFIQSNLFICIKTNGYYYLLGREIKTGKS